MKAIYTIGLIYIAILTGCSQQPVAENNGNIKGGKKHSLLTVPSLTGSYYGQFFLSLGSSKTSLGEFTDPELQNISFDRPAATQSNATFLNSVLVNGVTVNGSSYEVVNSLGKYGYIHSNPLVKLDGSNNTFEWQDGPTTQSQHVAYSAPAIGISSPTFMSTITKSNGMTIQWTSSTNSDDYVQITLVGKESKSINSTGSSSSPVGTYSTYTDDNGSFTIPSSVLSSFAENNAILTIARGVATESTINSKNYLFVVATSRAIDLKLQ